MSLNHRYWVSTLFPSLPLPEILVNSDDYNRVMFRLDDEPLTRIGRLTYPHRAFGEKGNVPILGPVGAALIGMRRNSAIEWLDEGRTRTLTVLDYGW